MNTASDTILEQLSALMDGELPDAEARFLQRRIEGDPGLQARWARMQVASSCIKGQPWTPARPDLCAGVGEQIAAGVGRVSRHGMMRWAVAASLLAVAILLGPRLMHSVPAGDPMLASSAPVQRAGHLIPSPGSADLVAARVDSVAAPLDVPSTGASDVDPAGGNAALVASNAPASRVESPLPLSTASPTEFPLVESGDKRSWPRSGLAQASDDPALEAYLVRHNQMLANDGLGGFVPYLDVVATNQGDGAAAKFEGDAEPAAGQADVQQ